MFESADDPTGALACLLFFFFSLSLSLSLYELSSHPHRDTRTSSYNRPLRLFFFLRGHKEKTTPFVAPLRKCDYKRSKSAASWTDKGQGQSTRVETQEGINHSALFFGTPPYIFPKVTLSEVKGNLRLDICRCGCEIPGATWWQRLRNDCSLLCKQANSGLAS